MSPNPLTVASDWLMWGAGALAALLAVPLGVVKRNRDRSKKNQRQLQGDPNDPNTEGVLQIAADTRERIAVVEEKVDDYRREMRHEHEAVMDRLDDIGGNT